MGKTKLASLFLLSSLGCSMFIDAQTSKVSLTNKNEQLKDVINEIEKQTNYLFVYNTSEIDLNKRTSVNAKDESVDKVLASVFNEKILITV